MLAGSDRLESRWHLDPADLFHGVRRDKGGPRIGPVQLLQRKASGWEPRPIEELNLILQITADYPIDLSTRSEGLAAATRAMNEGDLARAIFCTLHMRLVPLQSMAAALRAMQADWLAKASADDPEHPGWPAGAPNGQGGKFRPKAADEASPVSAANASGNPSRGTKSTKMDATLRRSLRFTITAGMKAWNDQLETLKALEFPNDHWNFQQAMEDKFKHLNSAVLLDNVAMILTSVQETNVNVDAAVKFAAGGPRTLEKLRVSNEDLGFPSMDAFVKIDEDDASDLEKRFGPAPPGCEYHHICEQTINAGRLDSRLLHSTLNIAVVPSLLHVGVSADTSSLMDKDGKKIVTRQWLKTQPFEEQWQHGVRTLQKLGIVKK